MPNWCFSSISINASKKSIDKLEDELKKATSSNPLSTDFGNWWLGYLLMHIGYSMQDIRDKDIRCRGQITYNNRESDTEYHLDTESAWGPHIKCIKLFVDHFVDDAEISYFCEEPGFDLYWTNDKGIIGDVYIDAYFENEKDIPLGIRAIVDYEDCKKNVVYDALVDYLGHHGSWDKLTAEFDDQIRAINKNSYAVFHVYEYVPIGDDC